MFVAIDYRHYSYDSPKSFRVDRRAFTSICGSHNFSFTLAEYVNPPWDDATLEFVDTRFLEIFLRMVEHAEVVKEVIDVRFVPLIFRTCAFCRFTSVFLHFRIYSFRYRLAECKMKSNSEIEQANAMFTGFQKEVESQLDAELSQV